MMDEQTAGPSQSTESEKKQESSEKNINQEIEDVTEHVYVSTSTVIY